MQDKLRLTKIISLVLVAGIIAFTGTMFYKHRNFTETVVATNVTEVKWLSDYFPDIQGTYADAQVFVFDSGVPGGSMLLLGGSHPEEPSGPLAALLVAENAKVTAGRIFVTLHASNSASRNIRPGEGYQPYYFIETDWGQKQFRMGDRFANPLDSWPDPEVYIHYPSGQMLANTDIRNTNRTWPGRPNGSLAEKTTYAFMEMIRKENISWVMDLHEAELEYPVINAIVTHEKGRDMAMMAKMFDLDPTFLLDDKWPVEVKIEYSPPSLHGLTHREVGDHSDSFAFISETAEPMLDRIRGQTGPHLLLTGKDPLVMSAREVNTGSPNGLLYSTIDENGWPIDVRVARQVATTMSLINQWNMLNPDKPIDVSGIPSYAEIVANGIGHYYHDPSKAAPGKVFTE